MTVSAYSMICFKEARENPGLLRDTFPPVQEKKVPMGDVFTSCNWVMRDGFVEFILRDVCQHFPVHPKQHQSACS